MNFPKILSTSKKIFWTAPQTHFQWIGLEKTDPKLRKVDENRSSSTPKLTGWHTNINPLYGWVPITFRSLIQWNIRRIGSQKPIYDRSALIETDLWSAQLFFESVLDFLTSNGSMGTVFSTWNWVNNGWIGFENASIWSENASICSQNASRRLVSASGCRIGSRTVPRSCLILFAEWQTTFLGHRSVDARLDGF